MQQLFNKKILQPTLLFTLVWLFQGCVAFAPVNTHDAEIPEIIHDTAPRTIPAVWIDSAQDQEVFRLSVDGMERHKLMAEYSARHYGIARSELIDPAMIVVHTTYIAGFKKSFEAFIAHRLNPLVRSDIASGGDVNVGVHFLIASDGTIVQLLPLDQMGRHTVGLNHVSFGIELAAVKNSEISNAQLKAVVKLIKELKNQHPSIKYLIGHHEYLNKALSHYPLYLDLDASYTPPIKTDPGAKVMAEIRSRLESGFQTALLD